MKEIIFVFCDSNKLNYKGCSGAFDENIEIVFLSGRLIDYLQNYLYTAPLVYRNIGL